MHFGTKMVKDYLISPTGPIIIPKTLDKFDATVETRLYTFIVY